MTQKIRSTEPPTPWLLVNRQGDGSWRYRFWDHHTDWVHGDPPRRDKTYLVLGQVYAALAADCARLELHVPTTDPDTVEAIGCNGKAESDGS